MMSYKLQVTEGVQGREVSPGSECALCEAWAGTRDEMCRENGEGNSRKENLIQIDSVPLFNFPAEDSHG